MSEQDRGAYTPHSDAPLTFDARSERGGRGPAPMALLVSAIILVALVVGLLMFYRHGVRHAGQAPQVVGAPVAETKSAPPSGANAGDQATGLQVYKSEVAPPSEGGAPAPAFETPPEQPAPLPAVRPVAPPPAVITAPLRPVARAPTAPPSSRPVVIIHSSAKPAPATVDASGDTSYVAGSAFASHAAPHAASAAPHAPAPKPVEIAEAVPPKAAVAKPKPKLKPPEGADEIAAQAEAPSAHGGAMVQIGAFSSSALAQKGWGDTAHILPGQMAGKTRKVEMTSKDGKTFYRAYVGGFASKADAQSFCAALKAKGKPCFLK